jgi:hypothetical protein
MLLTGRSTRSPCHASPKANSIDAHCGGVKPSKI